MQTKLLRVLEQNEVERIGGQKPIKVDVRVITATHRDLEQQVKAGQFRQDLFHRIFVFPVHLPPLRERREDIPALVRHFAAMIAAQNGWKPLSFTDEALQVLSAMPWPGNIRELRNAVERIALFSEQPDVDSDLVSQVLGGSQNHSGAPSSSRGGTLAQQMEEHERAAILAAIQRNRHHITNTAKELGLERSHLYKKCQQLGIDLKRGD
jgi:DNA-binding NtrC family response regulator